MVIQEAVTTVARVNPKMRSAVRLANSLAEALLILNTEKRDPFLPN
jgi:hypothetical protein